MTPRQATVLAAIRDLTAERGYPPSRRELMARFRMKSRNGIQCHLMALRKKGLVTWDEYVARSLWVVEQT